jgi:tRNA pseudouridine55 synthase
LRRLHVPVATAIDGIVLLDKAPGLSSNEALQQVKRLFRARKAGHGGSLDPLASGMLPICLGEATKLAGALLEGRKCYQFVIRLGASTTTGDLEGEIVEECALPNLAADAVAATLLGFAGHREQVPPMHSALKHRGARLYELARRGIEVERPARTIHIETIELVALELPRLTVRTVCSKGTYVRTLAVDIARALGSCGYVEDLRRLWVEPFGAEPMATVESLQAAAHDRQALARWLLPPDRGVQSWPRVDLDAEAARRLLDGQAVTAAAGAASLVRTYDPAGRFLGIARRDQEGRVTARRLIADTRERRGARTPSA